MPVVVAVKFEGGCRVYHLDPGEVALEEGDRVLAETFRGTELGWVDGPPQQMPDDMAPAPLRKVLRRATEADLQRAEINERRRATAWNLALERIAHHKLEMKVVDVHYAFDGSKMTLYFTADGRVDFRELVKDLASSLRSRVQLLQIGARDAARFYGGLGVCGRELCCVTWLQSFDPISMKMAKDQSLFLNPSKFSGRCGKLMCCLRYEHDIYVDAKGCLPPLGAFYDTPKGRGRVVEVNVLKKEVIVDVPSAGRITVQVAVTGPICEFCAGAAVPPRDEAAVEDEEDDEDE